MPQFEAIHTDERKKFLWRTITAKKNVFKMVLGFFAAGIVASVLKKATGLSKKSSLFENTDAETLIIIILIIGAIIIFLYLLFKFLFTIHYKSLLRKLQRKVDWNFIDIGVANITMRMDYDELIISKNEINEIYFASEGERKMMISKNWDQPVDLEVLKVRTESGFHYIVLNILKDADYFLTELNNFYPITDFDTEETPEDEFDEFAKQN